jgi:hypothetical protein
MPWAKLTPKIKISLHWPRKPLWLPQRDLHHLAARDAKWYPRFGISILSFQIHRNRKAMATFFWLRLQGQHILSTRKLSPNFLCSFHPRASHMPPNRSPFKCYRSSLEPL